MGKAFDNVNQHATKPSARSGDELLELVHTVMHQLRSQQYQAMREGPLALTHMESKVLGYFGRLPGATQSDLVQHSGRDKAQLARLIKGLRERGLLAAEADEADRRNLRLRLTDEGQGLLRTLQQRTRRVNAQAVQGLSRAEHEQLRGLLQRLKDNLERDI
ncbi:MAG: MarR family winged helix-turn-helix transcriptional regulator [Pseudomonadota bacterium]